VDKRSIREAIGTLSEEKLSRIEARLRLAMGR
jgi:mRNA-degrading endonuclease toxin of MazEF toxin-antitoxin module